MRLVDCQCICRFQTHFTRGGRFVSIARALVRREELRLRALTCSLLSGTEIRDAIRRQADDRDEWTAIGLQLQTVIWPSDQLSRLGNTPPLPRASSRLFVFDAVGKRENEA